MLAALFPDLAHLFVATSPAAVPVSTGAADSRCPAATSQDAAATAATAAAEVDPSTSSGSTASSSSGSTASSSASSAASSSASSAASSSVAEQLELQAAVGGGRADASAARPALPASQPAAFEVSAVPPVAEAGAGAGASGGAGFAASPSSSASTSPSTSPASALPSQPFAGVLLGPLASPFAPAIPPTQAAAASSGSSLSSPSSPSPAAALPPLPTYHYLSPSSAIYSALSDLNTPSASLAGSSPPVALPAGLPLVDPYRYEAPVGALADALERKASLFAARMTTALNANALAVQAVEESGIVFIDEIDKICRSSKAARVSGDASDEGVQRDLLPIIEGTTVQTNRGKVNTDHILFIASGAFHTAKPTDLLAELLGRLPIRVTLAPLSEAELFRVLTEPVHNLLMQQSALLATEGVSLAWSEPAIRRMAGIAAELNTSRENLGARRLHAVVEAVVDELSFDASELARGTRVEVTADMVDAKLSEVLSQKPNLANFIL